MVVVWFAYIKYQIYSMFVLFFAFQLVVPIYIVTITIQKTDQQKFELSKGALFAALSVACWSYERHLHQVGQCPDDPNDARYYLHGFWHIGTAMAHMHFMRCIDQNKIELLHV